MVNTPRIISTITCSQNHYSQSWWIHSKRVTNPLDVTTMCYEVIPSEDSDNPPDDDFMGSIHPKRVNNYPMLFLCYVVIHPNLMTSHSNNTGIFIGLSIVREWIIPRISCLLNSFYDFLPPPSLWTIIPLSLSLSSLYAPFALGCPRIILHSSPLQNTSLKITKSNIAKLYPGMSVFYL